MRISDRLLQTSATAMLLSTAALSLPSAGHAQEPRFELTPFAAYRIGGDFEDSETDEDFDIEDSNAFGLIFNIQAKPEGQWELLYARQSTDLETEGSALAASSIELDVEYLQLGGVYQFEGDRAEPFIALTLGVTHFDPKFADLDSENYFSASFGGGIRMDATEQIGFRLEGRVYSTFLDSDSRIFCSSTFGVGECLIEATGTTLTQWEARAGLVFRF